MNAVALAPQSGAPTEDSMSRYLYEINRLPRLTPEQELELGGRIAHGDDEALRIMVECNLRLVVSVAKRYPAEGISLLDLVQEGNIGLIHAARKFDYRRGHRFSTYAIWWIRQAVSRAVINQGQTIRVPVHVAEGMARHNRILQLVAQEGEDVAGGAAATRQEQLPERVIAMARVAQQPLSLDQATGDEGDLWLGEAMEDRQSTAPAEAAEMSVLRDHLRGLLETLPARERQILELRFGLMDGRQRSLKEVSGSFGLTRERIRQLESSALKRLRGIEGSAGLRVYLS